MAIIASLFSFYFSVKISNEFSMYRMRHHGHHHYCKKSMADDENFDKDDENESFDKDKENEDSEENRNIPTKENKESTLK